MTQQFLQNAWNFMYITGLSERLDNLRGAAGSEDENMREELLVYTAPLRVILT
jgi:hypothetical protein